MKTSERYKGKHRVASLLSEHQYRLFKMLCAKENRFQSAQFEWMLVDYLERHYKPEDFGIKQG